MIPVRLSLRNFLCYRDVDPLDFRGIHLACLSGENGHGKSAILDAMTWALWGKARAATDDLIHYNETEMEVELEFLLDDNAYRVIRKRDKRSRGQSQLELQAEKDGAFYPLTETSMRGTQARVNEILRMDYDTFINSAFLLQGRADEFTNKTPMQRKEILAEILGLSVYDEYEARAKEQAKERDNRAKLIDAQVAEWDRELAQRESYEAELSQAEAEVSLAEQKSAALDVQVQALRKERHDLEAKRTQTDDIRDRIRRLHDDLAELQRGVQVSEGSVSTYERVLLQRDRIEQGYGELAAVRKRHDELNLQMQQVMQLNQRKTDLEKQLETKRQEFLMEKRHLEGRSAEMRQTATNRARWEDELQKIDVPLKHLVGIEARLPELRNQLTLEGEEVVRLESQIERLQGDVREAEEKSGLLSIAEAQCPLCGSDLTEEHRQQLLDEVLVRIREQQGLIAGKQEKAAELSDGIRSLRAEIRKLEVQLDNLPALHQRKAKLEASLDDALRAETELAAIEPQIEALAQKMQGREWAADLRARLEAASAELLAVGYDEHVHQQVRSSMQELAGFEDERARLLAAQENLRTEREHLEELKRLEKARQTEIDDARTRESILAQELVRWDDCLLELKRVEGDLSQLQVAEARARQVLGAARQKLEACRHLDRLKKEKMAERNAALHEKGIYDELRLAFGKRGIQAMIIENAVPEIEDEANAILFRMTDGRMRIQLDTQRETKSRDVVETLDIVVSDELGPRPYELYSGGEAFRINFALRVALSKLLARRAGASLRTLVIDEGFGTQDAQGRERLIESINAIQDDFDKVLVVTHIDELKDAFPVHIEVFKTPSGSKIRVS